MRKLLYGIVTVALTLTATTASHAEWMPAKGKGGSKGQPIIRDHRTLADLDVTRMDTAGDLALVSIVNRGGPGKNKATIMRMQMFEIVAGKERLVAVIYASVPEIASGTHKVVTVRFPKNVMGHRLVGDLDYNNQVPESNERNNRFSRLVK